MLKIKGETLKSKNRISSGDRMKKMLKKEKGTFRQDRSGR